MNRSTNWHTRQTVLALCAVIAVLMPVLHPQRAFTQQQGGPYVVNPSVIAGGGGSSANGPTRVEGSTGQPAVSSSTGGAYTVDSGFWPNAVSCALALSSSAEFFSMSGGQGSVNVNTPGFCSWSVLVSDDWITLTSKDTGNGNDTITFEVRENFTSSARQGSINLSGISHIVVQDGGLGEDCGYSISPLFQSFAGAGGNGTIQVVAEERCAWQAVSSHNWITITSINCGIGNGAVTYSVAPNPGIGGRSGSINIAGRVFAVKQKSG